MRNEAFYATVAQVLPALLIALTVEIGLFLRKPIETFLSRPARRNAELNRPDLDSDELKWLRMVHVKQQQRDRWFSRVLRGMFTGIAVLCAGIAAGEVCATTVLFTGTRGWFPILAGPFCLAVMISAAIVVTALPVWRLHFDLHIAESEIDLSDAYDSNADSNRPG
ncbi:hypothetical protein [Actinoplanes sp. NPDC049118]|uniref:hypothetical protein n=1 Tax=Actinoplanes sp. NPDC049118 TaxID=3155769 RepID=UPI0034117DBC